MAFTYDTSDAVTVSGVFPVWDEGVREHFDRTTGWARRVMRCKWDDRVTLMTALRGGATLIGGVTIYNAAQAYPPFPFLYIDSLDSDGVEAEGLTQDAFGIVAYKYARITALYTALGFVDGVDTGSLSIDFGTEIIRMPDSSVMFTTGGQRLLQPPNKRIPCQTVVFVRRNLAALPIATILNASANPLDNSSLFGAATGSLLFDGGRSFQRFTTAGASNYDLELRFVHRDNPKWNEDFDGGGNIRGIVTSAGDPLYGFSNLSLLTA